MTLESLKYPFIGLYAQRLERRAVRFPGGRQAVLFLESAHRVARSVPPNAVRGACIKTACVQYGLDHTVIVAREIESIDQPKAPATASIVF